MAIPMPAPCWGAANASRGGSEIMTTHAPSGVWRLASGVIAGLLTVSTCLFAADDGDPLARLACLRPEDGTALVRAVDLELRRTPPDAANWERRLLTGMGDAAATDFGCQTASLRLTRCATAASVPVVEPWLAMPGRAHGACLVLEAVAAPAATAALVRALGTASGPLRLGIIASLGRRGDAAAVPALVPLAGDGDAAIARAALLALGRIGSDDAIAALQAGAASDVRDEALLIAADRRQRLCEWAVARSIYRGLCDPTRASTRRGHALACLASAGEGDLLIPGLCEALAGTDAALATGAARALAIMPGPTATVAIANRLADWPAEVQLIACGVLAMRRDPIAADAATPLLKSPVPAVRQAALAVFATGGDVRHLDPLLALAGDRTLGKAVRTTIAALAPREAIDQALLARLGQADAALRPQLLAILAERRCTALTPILLADVRGDDADRAAQALPMLGDVAAADDLPALLDLLAAKGGDGTARDAVASLLRRHPDPVQAAALVDARWDGATPELRRSLLRLGAALGRNLPRLRSASADPALADAVLLAAAEWPSAVVAEDLAAAVNHCRNPALRQIGLRGLGRILELPDHPAHERSAQLLHLALGTAASTEDKRTMLAALANHPDDQSLELALEFLHDTEVRGEAQSCLLNLAKAMVGTQSDKLRPTLQKLKAVEDKAVQKEAARLLATIDQP